MRKGWMIRLAILFLALGGGGRTSAWATPLSSAATQPAPPDNGPPLVDGRFGKALNLRAWPAFAPARADYNRWPITVECWAKLHSKTNDNYLVSSEAENTATRWEMYTEAQSGQFTVHLPGVVPSDVSTTADICDDKWHYLAMVITAGRIRLSVDGSVVADQAVPVTNGTPTVGEIDFGTRLGRDGGCDGLLDEVRISRSALDIKSVPTGPLTVEDATIALWRFDSLEQGRLPDIGRLLNPATIPGAAKTVAERNPTIAGPLPVVDAKTSVEWRNVGNDRGGMRYSTLTQINRTNVQNLTVAWTYSSGDSSPGSTIECTPLMVDGVLYVTTPRLKIVALDAATGREIWRYDPHSGGVNRGVAYWSDGKRNGQRRILMGTPDGRLISLDAHSGEPDPAFGKGGTVDLRAGMKGDLSGMTYAVTSAPAIFENLVIPGIMNAEAQPGAPGDIRAFDIRTGREVWRFVTVPPPGEFGHETWEGDGWIGRSGVNPWSGYTVDEKRGILFCGTGSASSDFYGADRKGADLFANCTLALDARTGKRLWHFQTVHHDLWDHDTPCPPVMVTVRHEGKTVDAVAQATKAGYCYLFDRETGKPLFDVIEEPAQPSDVPGEAAWPTQPRPVAPPAFSPTLYDDSQITNISPEAHDFVVQALAKLHYGHPYTPPSVAGSVISPGFHGGANWSGASFDPTTGLLYVNSNNVPYVSVLRPNANGGYDFGGYTYFNDQNGYPASRPPWGSLTAIDLNTGTFAWQIPFGEYPELTAKGVPVTGTENFGGTIVTEGGLVFVGGTKDEKFHAYDKTTGKLLWDYHLPAGGYCTPSTYRVNGRQYVVIGAGGGGKMRTKSGDTYVVFALPEVGE